VILAAARTLTLALALALTLARTLTPKMKEPEQLVLDKKRLQDQQDELEKQIFQLEKRYIDETRELGNAVTGWDALVRPRRLPPREKGRPRVPVMECLFSLSSASSPAALTLGMPPGKSHKRKEPAAPVVEAEGARSDGAGAEKKRRRSGGAGVVGCSGGSAAPPPAAAGGAAAAAAAAAAAGAEAAKARRRTTTAATTTRT